MVLEKTLESSLDCKEIKTVNPKGNQSWIFIERTDAEIEKLELQCFDHLIGRTDFLKKTQILGKTEGRRRRGQQRIRWLDGITDSMDEFEQALGVGDKTGKPGMLQRVRHDWETELNWTEGS